MNLMPKNVILGLFVLKLILSFGLSNDASANEASEICQIRRNFRVFLSSSFANDSGQLTQNSEMTCIRINSVTYQILIDGEPRYIHRNAIINMTQQPSLNAKAGSDVHQTQPLRQRIEMGRINGLQTLIPDSIAENVGQALSVPSKSAAASEELSTVAELAQTKQFTRTLESEGWVVVRAKPNRESRFECSVVIEGSCKSARNSVTSINQDVELYPTGERTLDEDHNDWYFKANFEHAGQSYSGWFSETQTEVDSSEAVAKSTDQQRTDEWFRGSSGSNFGPNVEVADSEPTLYQLPMNPESQAVRSQVSFKAAEFFKSEAFQTQLRTDEAEQRFSTSTADDRRNLIQLHPTRAGMCGSYNYSDDPAPEESYAHPMTACVLSKLAEEWRKNFCPGNGACRLEIGDISHHTNRLFDGHKTHTDGYCVDFRPIKDSGSGPLNINSGNYDQEKTRQLIELITTLGGDTERDGESRPLIFNDPDFVDDDLTRVAGGHANHIHVCFRPQNPTVQSQCQRYQPDEQLCPTSVILFNHPSMVEMRKGLNDLSN